MRPNCTAHVPVESEVTQASRLESPRAWFLDSTVHPPSASEGLMGLEVFSQHAPSGCAKNEFDTAIGSLDMGHGDLYTHNTFRGRRGRVYFERILTSTS